MEDSELERDQPLTPAGRLFLQPLMDQVINCAIASVDSLDIEAFKNEVRNSVMLKHPRFCSLMVRDSGGREHWRRTEVNIDHHLIIRHQPLSDDSEDDAVNDYMADLSFSSPLSMDKPLWEIHLLVAHRTAVFRLHHALGDGISLMSMLLSSCRRIDDPEKIPAIGGVGASSSPRRQWGLLTLLKVIWYTLIYVLELSIRTLWLRDKRTVLSGGAGVELWPRKLATSSFSLEDMKTVKRAVPDATINDVLFGIITCGLSKYLDIRSPKALQEGHQITGVAMVNLRPHSGLQDFSKLMDGTSRTRWGNKFGMLLLPVHYHGDCSDPLQFVKRAKAMIDKKKLSLEASCSYTIGNILMSLFGAKLASILNYRIVCNTTFTMSNLVGPREKISIASNPVKYIRVTSSSLSHAVTMHMVSYAGTADMQILVAKDVIPDPKVLAKCLEDALVEMKEAAVKT
ncbi:wax ester synthase/diacylglycerol acyltransferase 11-like isoform X1 [Primulina tabacum]|uniref:wax ester synthase/diacylglycerol acyltransferase 11-like isoform X1 n=1 Tax=Primulina tabacum TaxID=48773 RepID=UPI003F592F99